MVEGTDASVVDAALLLKNAGWQRAVLVWFVVGCSRERLHKGQMEEDQSWPALCPFSPQPAEGTSGTGSREREGTLSVETTFHTKYGHMNTHTTYTHTLHTHTAYRHITHTHTHIHTTHTHTCTTLQYLSICRMNI